MANITIEINPSPNITVQLNAISSDPLKANLSGATFTGNISAPNLNAPSIQATTSAGLNLKTSSGSTVLNVGAGGGVNATFYGNVSMNSANKIVNHIDPSSAQDVATKNYVDTNLNTLRPGGSDTQVQFNNNGVFGGDNNNIWDNTNKRLSVGTNGDNTGTDPLNIYKQMDSYTPNASDNGYTSSHSRGTGLAPTESLDGDLIGLKGFFAYNGSAYVEVASVRSQVSGTTANNRGGRLVFNTKANGGASGTRLTIENSGTATFTSTVVAPQVRTTLQSLTPTGTTQTINFNSGSIINLNLASATGTVVLTLSNPQSATTYIIKAIQGATPRNLTFPTGTTQAGGGGVTYTGTASQTDIIAVLYDGTNYFISVSKNYS